MLLWVIASGGGGSMDSRKANQHKSLYKTNNDTSCCIQIFSLNNGMCMRVDSGINIMVDNKVVRVIRNGTMGVTSELKKNTTK